MNIVPVASAIRPLVVVAHRSVVAAAALTLSLLSLSSLALADSVTTVPAGGTIVNGGETFSFGSNACSITGGSGALTCAGITASAYTASNPPDAVAGLLGVQFQANFNSGNPGTQDVQLHYTLATNSPSNLLHDAQLTFNGNGLPPNMVATSVHEQVFIHGTNTLIGDLLVNNPPPNLTQDIVLSQNVASIDVFKDVELLSNSTTVPATITFINQTFSQPSPPPSSQLPRTEIEIGAVCPPNTGTVCTEHQTVKVRFHWVCPGVQTVGSGFVCPETDFDVVLSINGKLAFAADGTPINSNSPTVPAAPCANGYLIGWVIDQFDRPIKFDGLIGDAVLRGPQLIAGPNAGFSTAVAGYKAVTIQADPALATGALIATVPDPATGAPIVAFDGGPGHYQAVSGTLFGDVKFDRTTAGGGPSPTNALSETWLLLLTLDVRLNLPNNPTFVPLDFFNESLNSVSSTNPNFERLTSTSTEFLCWTQVQLSAINPNLTQVAQGTRKGGVIAGAAEKVPFAGIADTAGATNLIGLVQTIEGTLPNRFFERGYVYSLFHPPPRLSDSDEPGSVIVFPKFTNAAAVSVQ
jgi:hypothetical protein